MKRLKYKAFSKADRDYWKNMEVNIDSFCNSWEDRYEEDFISKLETFSPRFVRQIIEHFGIRIPFGNVNLIELLRAETRQAIETYCVISFAYKNPKVLSEIFKVQIVKKKVNRTKVTEHVFKAYQDKLLGIPSSGLENIFKNKHRNMCANGVQMEIKKGYSFL